MTSHPRAPILWELSCVLIALAPSCYAIISIARMALS